MSQNKQFGCIHENSGKKPLSCNEFDRGFSSISNLQRRMGTRNSHWRKTTHSRTHARTHPLTHSLKKWKNTHIFDQLPNGGSKLNFYSKIFLELALLCVKGHSNLCSVDYLECIEQGIS